MTWEEIMRRVLPPAGGLSPQITLPGAFGAGIEQGRHPPSTIPHKGVDFNFPVGQTGVNKGYPVLHSAACTRIGVAFARELFRPTDAGLSGAAIDLPDEGSIVARR